VLLTFVVLVQEVVTTIAPPGGETVELGHFVVEETGAETAAPLFETEPLQNVGFLTFTGELVWSPFSFHVLHSVVPSLTRVEVYFPTVLLGRGGPVGNLEAFEDGAGLSVETDVTDTLE